MNVSIRQLQGFLTLATCRSFSQAAQQVCLSQPAFSLSIRRLEEAVGARLFDRDTRTVALTSEGQEFLPVAERLVADWATAFSDMRELIAKRRGRIVVAALPSLAAAVLPVSLARYASSYPGVELGVRDVIAEEVLRLVKSGKVDLGLSVDPGDAEDLIFEPLLSDRFVAVCSNDHALAAHEQVSWAELSSCAYIAMGRSTSVRQHIDIALDRAGVHLAHVIEVDHLATVSGMIAAGLGVSALPSLCLPVVLQPSMVWRPIVGPELHRRLGLLRRRRQSLSVAAATLATELREQLRSRP